MQSHSKSFFYILSLIAILASLLGTTVSVTPARAAGSIVVNSNADAVANDGSCTLREAMTSAETDTTSGAAAGECAAGSGTDTITFDADYTITLGSQLPPVTTTIIINGTGAADTIIQANAATNTATYRVFEVINNLGLGKLSLDGLNVRNGRCNVSCTTNNSHGGGILNAGTLTITNSKISGNTALLEGGGIANLNAGTLTITNSTVSENSSRGSTPNGGGVVNYGTLTVTNSTFSDNSSSGGLSARGGGISHVTGALTVTNSTFSGNSSVDYGGGLYIQNNASATVTNSTFSGNYAFSDGGGIAHFSSGTLTLNNSILADSLNDGEDCYMSGGTVNGSHNLIEFDASGGNACGTTAPINSDAGLGVLADNGGPTQTMALLPSSPAIGAGDNTICDDNPGPNNLDQRGLTRPQNGACDIGAFESNEQPGPTFVVNTNEDSTDDSCDAYVAGITDCTLREAITYANNIGGTDTITFAANYTITLGSQLPAAADTMIITGNGVANTIIQANAAPNTASYRIFEVATTGNLTLDGLTIKNGRCNGTCSTNSIDGGGILNKGSLSISDVIISNNSSTDAGGGLYNDNNGPTLTNVTITNVTFSANSAPYGGGMFTGNTISSPTLKNVTFSANSAATEGGGMYNFLINPTLTNVTFNANSATSGGGIYNFTSNPTLTNVTFSGNLATNGGGMYNYDNSSPTLKNTIIANSSGGDCVNSSSTLNVTSSNNLIEGTGSNACGLTTGLNGNIIGSDPALGILTGSPAYFPLQNGSPAIDAGNDTVCAAAPVGNASQNGITRPVGTHCDIGSVEEAALIDVSIGGTNQGSYAVAPGGSSRKSFVGINGGPVQLDSDSDNIVAAERVIYTVAGKATSFSEMMALPNSLLNTTYWLPWYNNVDLDTQLRFGNVSGAPASVHVYIGGTEVSGSPFALTASGAGQSTRVSFAGVNGGPVQIVSDQPIVAAERVIYNVDGLGTSFSEMMALPASQLNTTYWLPWYNNVDLDTQLRIGNVSGVPASVHVYIGGTEMTGSPFALTATGAGQSTRISFAGVNAGPVQIVSDQNIVAAERVIYTVAGKATSFTEMMALSNSQVNTTYWLPWYNNVDLDTQLRIGNVSGASASVHVYIGGVEMTGSPFALTASGANQSKRISFVGINNGPVQIVSDQNIVAAERVIYTVGGVATSFSEMMALPNSQINTTYWLPWYNNVDLDTQLRFGVP